VATAEAWISTGSGAVHACVNVKTRALTVPKSGSCPRGTTPLTWHIPGPQGKAGPARAPGWGDVIAGPGYNFKGPHGLASDGSHIWGANIFNNTVTAARHLLRATAALR
jgi:hypothetical protein